MENLTHANFTEIEVTFPAGMVLSYGYLILLQLFCLMIMSRFTLLVLVTITVYACFFHALAVSLQQTNDESVLVAIIVTSVAMAFHLVLVAIKCRRLRHVHDTNVTIEPV